jgi:hypothetical protein
VSRRGCRSQAKAAACQAWFALVVAGYREVEDREQISRAVRVYCARHALCFAMHPLRRTVPAAPSRSGAGRWIPEDHPAMTIAAFFGRLHPKAFRDAAIHSSKIVFGA